MSQDHIRHVGSAGAAAQPRSGIGLLRPSLSGADSAPASAPYSSTTSFVCAFLGGPFAVLVIGAMNIHRCRRWRRDALFMSLLVLGTMVWVFGLPQWDGFPAMVSSVNGVLGSGGRRYANRAYSLVLFGLLYWRHLALDRAATLVGLPRPNGWIAGLAAIAGAAAIPLLLSHLLP